MIHTLVPRENPLEGVLEPLSVDVASSLFLFYVVTRVLSPMVHCDTVGAASVVGI